MAMKTTFLFDQPQREVASLLRDRLDSCTSGSLVAGFMTADGIEAILEPLRAQPGRLRRLVVGAGTYRAFEGCDRLLDAGVDPSAIHVHLGFTRTTRRKRGFVRYHPMLHSKVYLMEQEDGTASAFVGSHNLTAFALEGLNGEAGVLLEGPSPSPEFDAIRAHIDEATRLAVVYDPLMKDAYSWWAEQYIEGLAGRFKDRPRDAASQRTMVIMAEYKGSDFPVAGEAVYFEIPDGIDRMTSTQTEVHLFLFDTLPSTPAHGLSQLVGARQGLKCLTRGLEDDQGGVEMIADWEIRNRGKPVLRRTDTPFRPSPQRGLQQIRVRVSGEAPAQFEYLFDDDRVTWRPLLDTEELVAGAADSQAGTRTAVRSEVWYRVENLVRVKADEARARPDHAALMDMSPESGNYILMSLRRRRRLVESGED